MDVNVDSIFPTVPEWQELPIVMKAAYYHYSQNTLPLDQLLAVLEVCTVSIRNLANTYLFDADSMKIMSIGAKLSKLDSDLESAANSIIVSEDLNEARQNIALVFETFQELWKELVQLSVIKQEDIVGFWRQRGMMGMM